MQMATRNVHDTYRQQHALKEMVVKKRNISNHNVKFSLSSIWYLMQRFIILYYSTLSVILLAIILMYLLLAYISVKFFYYTPSEYRDCRFKNSTQQCQQFIDTMKDSKNIKNELISILSSSNSPFSLISLWTSIVLSNQLNVFLWEYHNGKF